MKLSEILNGISDLKAKGNIDIDREDIACDSIKVTSGGNVIFLSFSTFSTIIAAAPLFIASSI